MKMVRLISLLVLLTSSVSAQNYTTDAFGVFPTDADQSDRSMWADTAQTPEVVEDILLFVGQKSHVAGRDEGHAVAMLVDRHGNLVKDGTLAEIVLNGSSRFALTQDGIAELIFAPGSQSGTYDAAVISGTSQSARATYRVTADLADIAPQVTPQKGSVRPENFVSFATYPLTDRFGNIAPSGVGAQMVLTHGDGRFSVASATVLNGRAQGSFLLRDMPDDGALSAEMNGNVSAKTDLSVEAITRSAPTRVLLTGIPSIEATLVKIGPVTTSAGHYLNDGANVSVHVSGASGRKVSQEGWLRDGRFETMLPIDPADLPFEVTVETLLGKERTTVDALTADAGQTR